MSAVVNQTEMPRKRILVLTSTFPRWKGDTEPAFVYELCNRFSSDFDIWVLAPHAPGAKRSETMGAIHVIRFRYFFDWGESLAYEGGIMAKLRGKPLRYLLVPLFLLWQWIALVRLVVRHRFDVVHAHWLFPQGFAGAVAKSLMPRFPRLICTTHGTDINGLGGAFFQRIKRFVIRKCDSLTVVSHAMKLTALSLGANPQKTTVIAMGVDTAKTFTPSIATVRRMHELLFVGRLDTQKGIDLLLHAMPDVLAKYPDCKLKVVGQGPARTMLQTLRDSLRLGSSVEFVGAVPNIDLPDYYRTAAALVFPSLGAEGLGLVCIEALACECPVVASNLPAVQEVVKDGVTGLTFELGSRFDLVQKILLILSDSSMRLRVAAAGRDFVVENYDWNHVVARYSEVLSSVNQGA